MDKYFRSRYSGPGGRASVSTDHVELSDGDGTKVSRPHFRRVEQDLLIDVPNVTLSNSI
jgi:hypothetical protein